MSGSLEPNTKLEPLGLAAATPGSACGTPWGPDITEPLVNTLELEETGGIGGGGGGEEKEEDDTRKSFAPLDEVTESMMR